MIVKGEVQKIIFESDDSDYKVFTLVSNNTIYKVCGDVVTLLEGEHLEIEIEKMHHNKYGEQFRLVKYKVVTPDSLDLMIKYLAAPFFPGIGPATAKNIVMRFGRETFNVIENNPELLESVPGISRKKAQAIHEAYKKEFKDKEAHQFLINLDVSPKFIHKIIEKYADETIRIVTENPYLMIKDIEGVGFKKADEIASKIGFDKNSPYRIRAIILYILNENIISFGHTCCYKNVLLNDISQNYLLPVDNVDDILLNEYNYLLRIGEIVETKVTIEDDEEVFVSSSIFYRYEKNIATRLNELNNVSIIVPGDVLKDITHFEEENNIKLHDDQKEAVVNALNNKVSIITGGPGTGKTTIIKCLVNILEKNYRRYALCAPTGRAAKRMEESTQREASTIHRLLSAMISNDKLIFQYNRSNLLPHDFIIMDEASMCDSEIMYHLLQAVDRKVQVVFVGDKDQLPPVGAGNFLTDIINSKQFTVINLSKIYRQGEGSLIIKNAHHINKGQQIEFSDDSDFQFLKIKDGMDVIEAIIDLIKNEISHRYGYDLESIQVLSAVKKGVLGVNNLNNEIQKAINPFSEKELKVNEGTIFRINDRVMNIKNRYDLEWVSIDDQEISEKGIFNGEIGRIIDIDLKEKSVIVLFDEYRQVTYKDDDLESLVLSYAISIHKSQGSEFPAVIMVVVSGSQQIINRKTIYTGLTRAKKLAYVISREDVFNYAIKNDYVLKRNTLLRHLILTT